MTIALVDLQRMLLMIYNYYIYQSLSTSSNQHMGRTVPHELVYLCYDLHINLELDQYLSLSEEPKSRNVLIYEIPKTTKH